MAFDNKTRAHAKLLAAGIVVLISALDSPASGQPLPVRVQCRPAALLFQKAVAKVIPDVTGCKYDDVAATLRRLDLRPQAVHESSDRPRGTILSQEPPPGAALSSLDLPAQPEMESSDRPTERILSRAPPSDAGVASLHAMVLRVSDGPEIVPGDDVSTPAYASSDVAVTASTDNRPGPYRADETIKYTFSVRNNGPSDAERIQVTDEFSDLSHVDVYGACTGFPCEIPYLSPNATASIFFTSRLGAGTLFSHALEATPATADPDLTNNSAVVSGTVENEADLSVIKTLNTSGPLLPGQSVDYTIAIRNAGPSMATRVQVTDAPVNLTLGDVSGDCEALPCQIARIAPGGSATIHAVAVINGEGEVSNRAEARGAEPDPNNADNSSVALANVPPPLLILVPAVEGMSLDDATVQIRSVDLDAGSVIREFRFSKPDNVIRQRPAAGERLPRGAPVELTASWSLAWMVILAGGVIGGMTGIARLLWPPHISPSLSPDVSVPDWPDAPAETAPGMSFDANLEIDEVDPEISVPGMSFDLHLEIDEVDSEISVPFLKETRHD